jgi:adenine-specific DNA methylase
MVEQKPLATARAVIFAQVVDDPSARPDLFTTLETQEKERQRLFRLIEELVLFMSASFGEGCGRTEGSRPAQWQVGARVFVATELRCP